MGSGEGEKEALLKKGSFSPSPVFISRSSSYLPYFFQKSPHISSSVKVHGATGSLTHVTLMKWRQWTFSVVLLPPHVPQPRVAVRAYG